MNFLFKNDQKAFIFILYEIYRIEMIYLFIFLQQLSSIKIIDLKKGHGDKANYGASLTVHYKGFLKSNGQEFDKRADCFG